MTLNSRQIAQLKQAAERARQLRGGSKIRAMEQARKVFTKGSYLRPIPIEQHAKRAFDKLGTDRHVASILGRAAGDATRDLQHEVIRYALSGTSGALVRGFLGRLGTVGKAVSMLLGRSSATGIPDSAIKDAVQLLSSLGFDVRMPPPSRETGRGFGPPDVPSQLPTGTLPTGSLPGRQYVPMQLVTGSSNVYAIGYNAETLTMRVQYLGTRVHAAALSGRGHKGKNRVRGQLGKTLSNNRSGPGPLYDYKGVPQSVFNRVANAASKGKAIWDNLRIRGTAFGHKYEFSLVAGSRVDVIAPSGAKSGRLTYIPRRAVGPGQFIGRTMKQGSSTFRSILPSVGVQRAIR